MWGLLLHAFLYFLPEIPALRFRAPTRNFRRHRPPHAAEGASRAISIPASQLQTTTAMDPY